MIAKYQNIDIQKCQTNIDIKIKMYRYYRYQKFLNIAIITRLNIYRLSAVQPLPLLPQILQFSHYGKIIIENEFKDISNFWNDTHIALIDFFLLLRVFPIPPLSQTPHFPHENHYCKWVQRPFKMLIWYSDWVYRHFLSVLIPYFPRSPIFMLG